MSPASSRTFAKFLMAVTVASLITLTLPAQGRAAFGYTDIAYISSQYRLNGITLTALDWWEPIVGYFEYGPCECIITYVNRVEVDALFYNPVGLEFTVPPLVESDGDAVLQLSGYWPSRAGTWRGVGLHYLLTDYYYGSQWLGGERAPLGGTQDTDNVPCVMPTGETTSSSGWRDDLGWYTVHEFRGNLLPASGVYAGHSVQEYQPSQGSDGCWAPGLPASYRYALSQPYNAWPVDGNASYGDSIGWISSDVVTDIRNFRSANGLSMPCDVSVPQQMKMLTCPGAPVYQSHNVTMRIGPTVFQVGRSNVTVARTWPINRAAFLSTEMNQYVESARKSRRACFVTQAAVAC